MFKSLELNILMKEGIEDNFITLIRFIYQKKTKITITHCQRESVQ